MNRRKARQIKFVLGMAVVLLLVGLSLNSIGNFLNPLKFVSEVTAQPEQYLNRNVQVVVFIVEGTWQQTGPNDYAFELTDGNATVNVEYAGDIPGTFKPGVGITVIGTFVSPDRVVANKLLAKCPSKYEQDIRSTIESKKTV